MSCRRVFADHDLRLSGGDLLSMALKIAVVAGIVVMLTSYVGHSLSGDLSVARLDMPALVISAVVVAVSIPFSWLASIIFLVLLDRTVRPILRNACLLVAAFVLNGGVCGFLLHEFLWTDEDLAIFVISGLEVGGIASVLYLRWLSEAEKKPA